MQLIRLASHLLILVVSMLELPLFSHAQDSVQNEKRPFEQQDLYDWLAIKRSKPRKPPKDNYMLLMPYISSNPTAGFMIGCGITYSFKYAKTDEHLSLITSNFSYSTNKLLNFNIKSSIYVMKERLILSGDWRLLKSSETTFGLGTASPNSQNIGINGYESSSDSLGQPLKYFQIRVHEIGSWEFFKNFYAGLGIHYDRYYSINDEVLTKGDTASSYHYQYSKRNGFDPGQYTSVGFSANILYDSRDNQVSAYKGYYLNLNYLVNLKDLTSTQSNNILLTDFRSYYSLDARSRNVLAFWLYGNFVTSGKVPYLQLPALGYDQRQRTGRGYNYGRFRGEDLAYGEAEYRFPISMRTGILGGVAFVNVTSTSDRENKIMLLDYFKTGYGGGLRIMLDKASRTRLSIDAGISNRTVGFYLSAQETF